MSDTKQQAKPARRRHQGVFTVEFALVSALFFLFIFGIIELARVAYMFNTLAEVTRRAAVQTAVTDFSDFGKVQRIRENAIFRNGPGALPFGSPVTDQHVNIEYLALTRVGGKLVMTPISAGDMPSCPAQNRKICSLNPNDSSCIRLVRVRICQPGSGAGCAPVPYETIARMVPISMPLPTSTTILPVGTLGLEPGVGPCG